MSSPSPDRPGPATLVGRAVVATIAEPWDFASAAGQNVLSGRIVAVSPATAPVEWIICEVSPFDGGSGSVSTVAAVRRYAGEEPIQALRLRGDAHVQLVYDPAGAALTPRRIEEVMRAGQHGLRHLVGSLRLTGT
jgi:hypothetical protein